MKMILLQKQSKSLTDVCGSIFNHKLCKKDGKSLLCLCINLRGKLENFFKLSLPQGDVIWSEKSLGKLLVHELSGCFVGNESILMEIALDIIFTNPPNANKLQAKKGKSLHAGEVSISKLLRMNGNSTRLSTFQIKNKVKISKIHSKN
jgi:hypothetical protein